MNSAEEQQQQQQQREADRHPRASLTQSEAAFRTAPLTRSESTEWLASVRPAEDSAVRPAEAVDFVLAPWAVERLVAFGMLVCADSFVFLVAMLPLRALLALASLAKSLATGRRPLLRYLSEVDLARVALMLVGLAAVWAIDVRRLSDYVRISEIKLKMVWMALEFLDKAMTKWGESIIGALLWALRAKASERKWPVWWHMWVAAVYMVLHPLLLLVHVSVLNLAVSGHKTAFFSLVVLVQFAELKSFGLKNTDGEKLSNMCYEDICERFELLILVSILFVANALPGLNPPQGMRYLLTLLAILYLSELVIDWLKHAAICNTNQYTPGIYLTRLKVLSDAVCSSDGAGALSDSSLALSRRIGFWPLPIGVVVLKMVCDCAMKVAPTTRLAAVAAAWASLLVLHYALRRVVYAAARSTCFERFDNWLALRDNMEDKQKGKSKTA
eukprot:m51a1_g7385 hypothetical protein (443) ;mRNA; f:115560-117608